MRWLPLNRQVCALFWGVTFPSGQDSFSEGRVRLQWAMGPDVFLLTTVNEVEQTPRSLPPLFLFYKSNSPSPKKNEPRRYYNITGFYKSQAVYVQLVKRCSRGTGVDALTPPHRPALLAQNQHNLDFWNRFMPMYLQTQTLCGGNDVQSRENASTAPVKPKRNHRTKIQRRICGWPKLTRFGTKSSANSAY